MALRILVTGAAGYIGGSIVTDFLASGLLPKNQIYAAVRAKDQADALSTLDINVLQLDLSDEGAINDLVMKNRIQLVIHTASSIDPTPATLLITALGRVKKATGQQTYFMHTSGLSAFFQRTGWPDGETKDSGPIFDMEKELAGSFPIRETDVTVTEHAKASGVTSFIVVPSIVYGRGTGKWNQLSVNLPIVVKASIEQRRVHKFPDTTKVACVHISDLVALYRLLVDKIMREEHVPSGKEGYYFAIAQEGTWHEILDILAKRLHDRSLIPDSKTDVWPSDNLAAEALGVPVQFVQVLWNAGANIVSERPRSIGWNPTWHHERFLGSIDQEINDVIQLGKAKSGLIDSLHAAAKG